MGEKSEKICPQIVKINLTYLILILMERLCTQRLSCKFYLFKLYSFGSKKVIEQRIKTMIKKD